MNYEVKTARDGENTLIVNGVSIYSQYKPLKSVEEWITREIDSKKKIIY